MAIINGTSGNNTLTGTSSADVITGKAGSDYIDGGLGADIILAGAGNDTVVYHSADLLLNGGTGFDTLLITGANQTINLNGSLCSGPVITGFEMIDIRGSGANVLNVSAAGVVLDTLFEKNSATNTYSTVIVRAGQDDIVNKGSGWTEGPAMTINSVVYHVYNQCFVKLLVEDRAPVAQNDAYNINEDALPTVYGSVLANDTDIEHDVMTVGLISGPAHAANFSLNSNGTFSYSPLANYSGDDVFTYRVTDSLGVSGAESIATATIHIASVNNAPVTDNHIVNAVEDTLYHFSVSDFAFTDPNDVPANNLKAVIIDSLPSVGVFQLNGVAITVGQSILASDIANMTYQAAANVNGAGYASFTFHVQDDGGIANGGVDMSSVKTMTIDVTSVNDAPVTDNHTVSAVEDTLYHFSVSDFLFSDPNDNSANSLKAVVIDSLPSAGVFQLNGVAITAGQSILASDIANITYQAAENANGTGYASFTFHIQDDGGIANGGVDMSSTKIMTIDVTSVNDAPELIPFSPQLITINEDFPPIESMVNQLIPGFSDVDNDLQKGIAITAVDNTHGDWQYSLDDLNWINIVGVSATNALLLDKVDFIRFSPDPNFNTGMPGVSVPSITYQAWDKTSGSVGGYADATVNGGKTAFSTASDTASITINSVNDPPAGTDKTVTILEDRQYHFSTSDFPITDPNDNPANDLKAIIVDSITGSGSFKLNGNAIFHGETIQASNIQNLVFTPDANGNGSNYASFTFYVQDNGGTVNDGSFDISLTSNHFTVNVTSVNDAPSGTDNTVTTAQGSAYTFNVVDFGFSDASDNPANTLLAVKIDTLPSAGSLTNNGVAVSANQFVSAADIAAGHLQFTPASNGSGNAYANFSFQVQDNGGVLNGGVDLDQSANTMTLNVTPVVTGSLVVTTVNDVVDANDGVTSLREALNYANTLSGAQSIIFAGSLNGGTITLTGGELHITGSNLTIDASNLASKITISGNDTSRVFNIGDNVTTTLNGLNIVHGNVSENVGGAGVLLGFNDTLNITNSSFQNNSTIGNGGAIASSTSLDGYFLDAIHIDNTSFTSNVAVLGGAIYNFGSISLDHVQFNGNTALKSAGAVLSDGTFSASNSSFTGNSVINPSGGGGAIVYSSESWSPTSLNIDHTVFTNNISHGSQGVSNGGAILFATPLSTISSTPIARISSTDFVNNYADGIAGAIDTNRYNVNIDNASFSNNLSKVGGAIQVNGGQVNLSNSVFVSNASIDVGGAIYVTPLGVLNSTHNTFTGNGSYQTINTVQGGAIYILGTVLSSGDTFVGNTVTGTSTLPNLPNSGGAIFNAGVLTLSNGTFKNNADNGFTYVPPDDASTIPAPIGGGGALLNHTTGVATVSDSTFSSNIAHDPGGAIDNLGVISVVNSTFANNSSFGGFFGPGGGIYSNNSLALVSNTFSNNQTNFGTLHPDSFGNGVYIASGTLESYGNIFNSSSVAAPTGTTITGQYNIFTDTTTGTKLIGVTNIQNANLSLGALQDNGGSTLTIAPSTTSPVLNQVSLPTLQAAIDANTSLTAAQKAFFDSNLPVDQIGGVRSGVIDLGAVELTTVTHGVQTVATVHPASNVTVTGTPSYSISGGANASLFNLTSSGGNEFLNFNTANIPAVANVGQEYSVNVTINNGDGSVAEMVHFLIGIL